MTINKFFLFIVLIIVANACYQSDKSGQENTLADKWGLLETVNISDTIRLDNSPQELKYTLTPEKTHSRYQIKIFFPSTQSNYYHDPELEDQFQSFQAQVRKQFVGTSVTIQNESQNRTVVVDFKKDQFEFNLGEQRPPNIWLASGIELNKNETYTISINLPEKRVEDHELHNPILVIGQARAVSL